MLKQPITETLFLIIILTLVSGQPALGKKMIRWEDDQGNVFYSDQVPPEFVKHRRETLNSDARVIAVVEAKKSKAQRELEARLKVLRKEQEKIIAKQKSHDKLLLSTFRSIDDMQLALKGKLLAITALIKVADGNLQRLQTQLLVQQKKAAEFERNGKKVPASIIKNIKSTDNQIRLARVEINKYNDNYKQVEKEFAADIDRFKFLTNTNIDAEQASDQSALRKAADELGLFTCISLSQCQKAWIIARRFVNQYSTTRIDVDSDTLIMGGAPFTDSDLSLSVSKMQHKNELEPEIFLDVRCRQSSLGKELCNSNKVRKIRASFRPYIQAALDE